MLTLRLFGAPTLEGGDESTLEGQDGASTPSILHMPKRFALLAYLASASPSGHHRRDTLLGLLWPDRDERRARAALSRTLYDLRQALGDGVVVSLGNDHVGLDWERIWCDVVAFERAIEEGALEEALDLYRGDLLPGFHVPGSIEFERWLDQERTRLRDRAVRAALELADRGVDPRGYSRRACEIDPDNERVLRRRLEILDTTGDRAMALREYEAFARRISDEYDSEPAPATRALIETIRAREDVGPELEPKPDARPGPVHAPRSDALHEMQADAQPGTQPGALPGTQPGRVSEPDSPSSSRVPTTGSDREVETPGAPAPAGSSASGGTKWPAWCRPAVFIAALLGLAVAGVFVFQPQGQLTSDSDAVAVLPFVYRGDPSLAYLAEGAASLLATDLDALPGVQSVDPRTVLSTAEQARDAPRGPRRGRSLAGWLGAGHFVLGEIIEVGGRLRISASLYQTKGQRWPLATATAAGTPEEIFDLTSSLALELYQAAAGRSAATHAAASATNSLPALEAFVEGERAFREGQFGAAQDRFRKAVAADTAFALAYLRLSQSANWTGAHWQAYSAAEAALRHTDRLTTVQQNLAHGWWAYVIGAADEAEKAFRAVLATDSLNADAWFYLGETIFHWAPTYGWSFDDARDAFRRVLTFEPGNAAAIVHLSRLAARSGDVAALDSLSNRLRQLGPAGDYSLEVRALRAWAAGDEGAKHRLLSELRLVDHPELWRIAISIAAIGADPGEVTALVPLLKPGPHLSAGDPGGHLRVRLFTALLETARGRYGAASAWLDSAAVLDPAKAVEMRGVFAALPYAPYGRAELDRIRAEIERYRAPSPEWPRSSLNRPQRSLLSGVLGARAGNRAAVERAFVAIDQPQDQMLGMQLNQQTARALVILRAESALAEGDLEAALRALDRRPLYADSILPVHDIDHERAHIRWLRANLLDMLGRDEEALRWYATFPDPAGNDLPYLAPAHLHRARIHERRGEARAALEHYARVVTIWRDADAGFQPLVDEARRGVARLSVEAGPLANTQSAISVP